MAVWKISEDVFYVGVNDTTLDLFESQYRIPDGVTYNSYVIKDSKIAVMDTVDTGRQMRGLIIWKKYLVEKRRIIWLFRI